MPGIFEAYSNHCSLLQLHVYRIALARAALTWWLLYFLFTFYHPFHFCEPDFYLAHVSVITRRIFYLCLFADSLYRKRLSIDGRQLNLEMFDPCSQVCGHTPICSTQIMLGDHKRAATSQFTRRQLHMEAVCRALMGFTTGPLKFRELVRGVVWHAAFESWERQ